ncbi:MAG: EthD family reductase [Chloroflexi bacterium]|nr:MAG: EthD family reductase [Chloroflexota bacterium]
MVKEMVLVKRKPGLSREEFIRQYEEVMAPLMLKHCPGIKKYARNYVRTKLMAPPGMEELEFDCITEVWYESKEAFKAFAEFAMSDQGKVIFDTEETFMDTSKTIAVLMEEKVT